MSLTALQSALLQISSTLIQQGYAFYAPTPETHAKLVARLCAEAGRSGDRDGEEDILHLRANSLQQLWGWSFPCRPDDELLAGLSSGLLAEVTEPVSSGLVRPKVRLSSLYPSTTIASLSEATQARSRTLYAHSAWPTTDKDAIFFGPDTYRFLAFLERAMAVHKPRSGSTQFRLGIDIGCGAGAGALHIAHAKAQDGTASSPPSRSEHRRLVGGVIGLDINERALEFARVNALLYDKVNAERMSDGALQWRTSDLFSALTDEERGQLDLVISNPPYIAFDPTKGQSSTYADGGEQSGLSLPSRIALESINHLSKGGLSLIYTGVPIPLDGRDPLLTTLQKASVETSTFEVVGYDVIDVDVFGDEMLDAQGPYGRSGVGRIAVVGAALRKL